MNWLRVLSIRLSCCGVWSNLILQRISRVSHKNEHFDFIGLPLCERYVHNRGMIYGYARVPTDGQSVEVQVAALTAAGAVKVYREVASGAKTDRAQLRQVLPKLTAGDVLLVTRLDRLARSTRNLLNTLAAIGDKGAGFKSLGDAWADTTTPHGCLMLTVLGGLAEFERELIVARTSEGRVRARARGVKLGPKYKLTLGQRAWVAAERARGESTRHLARIVSVSKATIARIPPAE
jgi:DNA invertase Pin-like site-specific DNA recombinase